ncbi:hypothetical protein [Maribellus mangrovi]
MGRYDHYKKQKPGSKNSISKVRNIAFVLLATLAIIGFLIRLVMEIRN